jgi:hypothetical protein
LIAIGALILVILAGPTASTAQVVIRCDPSIQYIDEGVFSSISFWLDDPIDIRTFEVRISYPPDIIQSVAGEQGELFLESGFFIWESFEEEFPGQWHGFAIVMGATDWVTGPGELFKWSFRGLNPGTVWIDAVDVVLYTPDAAIIPDVSLDPGMVVGAESRSWGEVKSLFR